jgi:CHAD domain-containing protein
VPNESIARFSAEQSSGFLRSLNLHAAHALKFPGIEAVHDLRVAVRRFRQVLKILKPWLPHEESRLLRRELKELMGRAGDVRDFDISLHLLRSLQVPKNRRVVSELHEARVTSANALHECLRDFHLRDTSAAWRRALKLEKARDATAALDAARHILPRILKDHLRRGRHATRANTPEKELHRFRIATKEIRYTVDLFAPLYGEAIGEVTEKLKKLQTHLGSIHDCVVTRDLVEDTPAAAGKKDILSALENRRERKTERFLRDYRRDFGDEAVLHRWKKALRHP